MSLSPEQLAALEQRGPSVVRLMFEQHIGLAGWGRDQPLPIEADCPDPRRGDVQDWLGLQERRAECRARATFWLAVVAAGASVIGVILAAALAYHAQG